MAMRGDAMFGLSTNDPSQKRIVAAYAEGFLPYRSGYAIRLGRSSPPIQISTQQKSELVDVYAAAAQRGMRVALPLGLVAMLAWIGIGVALGDEPHFWQIIFVLPFFAPSYTIPNGAIRKATAGWANRAPLVPDEEFRMLQRQRLRERPWSTILLPTLIVPFVFWQMHPHVPPSKADDYAELAMALGLLGVCLWAIVNKWRAGRAV
jgi:hypothetical protein